MTYTANTVHIQQRLYAVTDTHTLCNMRHSLTPDEGLLGSQLLDTGHNLWVYHQYGAAHMITISMQQQNSCCCCCCLCNCNEMGFFLYLCSILPYDSLIDWITTSPQMWRPVVGPWWLNSGIMQSLAICRWEERHAFTTLSVNQCCFAKQHGCQPWYPT